MQNYRDTLELLNKTVPLSEKLRFAHGVLAHRYSFIDRIAVAIYDPKTDTLSTFLDSSDGEKPLTHYQAKLSDTASLKTMVGNGQPRVVNDLAIFIDNGKEHTKRIRGHGYQASYTMPMYLNSALFGFVFFNSQQTNPFNEEALHYLDIFGHLISLMVINELANLRTLLATIKTARDLTHQRDFETGAHLDRMAHYSRLIARGLADKFQLDDEYIEQLFLFAPLHDIGKIGIPDKILLKPGKLTPEEYEVMKTHAAKGRGIIDAMLSNFALESVHNVDVLRNIAAYHHEACDGSGYPEGLKGAEIPIEARIVAVADIFDALTSQRPYKQAWSNDEAFATLQGLAGSILDADCVRALTARRTEVEHIQAYFKEDRYG